MLKVANSVISASQITGVLPVVNGGTGVTTSTGTGNTVLSAAPTLSGNVSLSTGNLVQGTAAKGFNFTANTPTAASGAAMTSQLLNWYEEGTWTPSVTAQSGTYTTVTTQSGTYTRVGRQVTIRGSFNVTVKGTGGGGALVAGLPFTPANAVFVGIGVDRSTFVQQVAIVYFNSGNVYINTPAGGDGIVATNVQDFTATYFV